MMRNVYLEGELGEMFSPQITIHASSFGDVISCLEVNNPNFRQYLIDCHNKGVGFTFYHNDKPIDSEEELLLNLEEGDMILSPAPLGSKKGLKIIAAIILIYISFKLGGPGATGSFFSKATLAKAAFYMGVNLAMTGLQELMAPDPSTDQDASKDDTYLFQGSQQNIIEGDPVPVLYGELRVPGRPISVRVRNALRTIEDYGEAGANYVSSSNSEDGGGGGGSSENLPQSDKIPAIQP